MKKTINLRPHHLMCILGFVGKGYSPTFTKHLAVIVEFIKTNENKPIVQIVKHLDNICEKCPNREKSRCKDELKVSRIDEIYEKALSLNPKETLSWKEIKTRIGKNVSLKVFHSACESCEWKKLGYCQRALKKFLNLK